ncbi:DUF1738 domain-containing protein (plasmid) [Edwardsiella hoshinae]|uniref:DNA primase TraC n=1 Tax=Edwardsiella hoshinae TaxID=93378 RepID=A0A376IYE2_9GAMM|nr:DUF1738 domain-containing protein [Edwardsiella hoshinae]STE53300.1 DNA primase TraC [Edwardsiella hoshinae]
MNTQNSNTAASESTERCQANMVKKRCGEKKDLYQTVTDNIIAALEQGVKPWVCPWSKTGISGMPVNLTTGGQYHGMNIMLLWESALKHGYADTRWLTYKQAQGLGGQVRKGEHGTTVFFYSMIERENQDGDLERFSVLKTFTVFNVEQVDGLAIEPMELPKENFNSRDDVELFFKATGAKIRECGTDAYFCPSRDEIVLPCRHLFNDAANFYATGLHELIHWSGGKSRLNREMKGSFGSKDYAYEELVAELGSAFLMADLGVSGEVQHENYIAAWLAVLENDKRFIFKAASAASKAHLYLKDVAK